MSKSLDTELEEDKEEIGKVGRNGKGRVDAREKLRMYVAKNKRLNR